MIRKIAARDLRPGMYVHDLGRRWVDHPFLLNRFLLRTEREIQDIVEAGIVEVAIDTDRGADLAGAAPAPQGGMHGGVPRAPADPHPVRGHRAAMDRPGKGATAGAAAQRYQAARCNAGGPDISERTAQAQRPPPPTAPRPAKDDGATPAHIPHREPPKPAAADAAAPQRPAHRTQGARPGARDAPAAPGVAPAPAHGPGEPPPATNPDTAIGAPEQEAQAGLVAAASAPPVPPRLRIFNEFQEAKRVHAESCRVVRDVLTDARLGRQVSIERTQAAVTRMAQSILRNPGPLLALCRIKQKDEYTFLHCVSVGALLMVFGRAAGLEEAAICEAGVGGLLHDIGKMTVPAELLNKPGLLTEREMAIMRGHVAAGVEILQATPGVTPVALQVAAEHHERHDGGGYPHRLKADGISRMGQMAAIVDVYDAITSDRVYHRALTPAEALKLLFEGSGTHFDPDLVQLLIRTLGIYPTGSLVMLESGRLAIVVEQSSGNLLQPRVRVVYDTRKAAFVTPIDVDLARTAGHGGEDRILRHESPQKWSVDPLAYLLAEVA